MKKSYALLIGLFILVLSFRLSFVHHTFSSSDAYFALREIESVQDHGQVFYEDPLSYGGRKLYFMPSYYYMMGFFTKLFGSFFALKILPNIIASSVIFLIYSIAKAITNDDMVSFVSAFAAGFLPIYNSLTINTLNPHFFIAFLFLLSLNYTIKCIKSKKYFTRLIISTTLLIIFHPFSLLFIISFWFYLILVKTENKSYKKYFLEFAVFISLLWYVIYYSIFKAGAFGLGMKIFSMGIPSQIYTKYYSTFTLLRGFSGIGIIVMLLGIFGAYKSIKRGENNKSNLLLLASFLTIFLFAVLKLVRLSEALSYFGFILVILSAISLKDIFDYSKKMRHKSLTILSIAGTVILLTATSLISCVYEVNMQNQVSKATVNAMEWLGNTDYQGVVLGNYLEGNLITYFAKMPDVMDTNFGWGLDTSERLDDIKKIYTNPLQTSALELTDKYKIKYILFTNQTKRMFNISELKFTKGNDCFPLIYNKSVKIFKVKCTLKQH